MIRKIKFISIAVLIVAFLVGLDIGLAFTSKSQGIINVRAGKGWSAVLNAMEKKGYRSGIFLRIAAHLGLLDRFFGRPKPGLLQCKGRLLGCMRLVTTVRLVNVEVRSGWNFWYVAKSISKSLHIPLDKVMAVLKDRTFAATLGINTPATVYSPFEGYLGPGIYRVDPSISIKKLIKLMVETQLSRVKKAHCTIGTYSCLTLASIVQGEANKLEDMRKIARVFLNRLRIHMPLQADPTLIYGIGGKPNPQKRRNRANKYNTYLYNGLPPGPICNPSFDAIYAVANPYDGKDADKLLYFVATKDGTIKFSKTFREHNRKVRRYLKRGR